ncbi:MAG: hypothetical protein HY447_03775 [Candidatus Omnitrophica bacterium]|nr:hypothetical protein [Candidatus Omnitrophota bacterium]
MRTGLLRSKTGEFWRAPWSRKFELLRRFGLSLLFFLCWFSGLFPPLVYAVGASLFKTHFSGYVKSLNFFTRSSGFTPELVDNPTMRAEEREDLFSSMERVRLKARITYEINETERVVTKIDYDHQAYFGSFVGGGDFRIAKKQSEDRQFLDLSQTFIEDEDGLYEHRLYRASVAYESDGFDLEIGRQQIPWGVGHFFTPTDLFNPFNPTQIELDERDGVDAVNLILKKINGYKIQGIYTPGGRQLHPQRYLARVSGDFKGYEVGLLGGRYKRDHAVGLDLAGNLKASAVRGEIIYKEAALEKDFFQFTVNADYNFPHNIHALLEYHFNGRGRRDPDDYQLDRLIRGEIQQLGRNYLALLLGHDLTSLIRIENSTIFNLDDVSFFLRPEIQYEIRSNLLLTSAAQIYLGENEDEFGQPKNLFLTEVKYSF